MNVQMANRAQVMAAAPAASPSLLAKAYAAAVDSRKTNARNTKILVQTPALWVCELTPNASNRERTTRTIVPLLLASYQNSGKERTYIRARVRMGDEQKPLHQVIL
jgi:hypothetical protein